MARIRIPGLVAKTSKAGVTSWYWEANSIQRRAGWKSIALGKDEGKAIAVARARNEEVAIWKEGGAVPIEVKPKVQTGTVSALIDRYRREYVNGIKENGRPRLRGKTKDVYETSLKRIEAWAGKHPVVYVTPLRIKALREAVARPVDQGGIGQAAAFNLMRQLRQLFAFAEKCEIIPKGSNPATSFDVAAPAPRRQIWEAEDEAAFIAAAYDLGMPSMALAMELALYSAQRRSDLIAFTEPQLQELEIFEPEARKRLADGDGRVWGWCLSQGKTSTDLAEVRMELPLEPKLLAKVQATIRTNRARDRAATPARLLTYVLVDDRTGLPWKPRAFHDAWTEIAGHAAKATGRDQMRELVWHDLRRTRVVRLRRRRMPKEMIASITGHSLQAIEEMLRVYGPVDPTVTASALATTLDPPTPITKARNKKKSEASKT